MSTLREKYGPEPSADGRLFGKGKPTIGIHSESNNSGKKATTASAAQNASSFAIDEANNNLTRQLEEKQNLFQRDMWLLQEQSKRAEAAAIGVSLQDARRVAQRQEVDLQQLRHTLSALKSEYSARAEAQKDAIEKASRELTLAKLKHMQASTHVGSSYDNNNNQDGRSGSSSSSVNNSSNQQNNNNGKKFSGPRVPADEMLATTDAIEQVEANLKASVDYGRKLVSILQRHLFLYPMSPVRMTLEELDPSLAARLEVNMNAVQQQAQH